MAQSHIPQSLTLKLFLLQESSIFLKYCGNSCINFYYASLFLSIGHGSLKSIRIYNPNTPERMQWTDWDLNPRKCEPRKE